MCGSSKTTHNASCSGDLSSFVRCLCCSFDEKLIRGSLASDKRNRSEKITDKILKTKLSCDCPYLQKPEVIFTNRDILSFVILDLGWRLQDACQYISSTGSICKCLLSWYNFYRTTPPRIMKVSEPSTLSQWNVIAVGWRQLSNGTRARCRVSLDAFIGHEAQPSTVAALVSNTCLRSISHVMTSEFYCKGFDYSRCKCWASRTGSLPFAGVALALRATNYRSKAKTSHLRRSINCVFNLLHTI